MILISLMLAATPTPGVRPDVVQRREASRPAPSVNRSKRLTELEAAVRSLPLAASKQDPRSGPTGM